MGHSSDFWIFRPFSPVFFLVSALFLLLLAAASLLLKDRKEKTKQAVLVACCLVTLIGFFVYKYFLSIDLPYNDLIADRDGFNWWGELPLQLCNINMILIPIAALTKKRALMSFCFFVGSICATVAILMPGTGFDRYSIFLPRMLGYFGTHYLIVIEALALVTFGLYRPRYRDILPTVATILAIAAAVFVITLLIRHFGLYARANYFYTVEPEGNFLLEKFHSWIPFPYLYLLPCLVILVPYMFLACWVVRFFTGSGEETE